MKSSVRLLSVAAVGTLACGGVGVAGAATPGHTTTKSTITAAQLKGGVLHKAHSLARRADALPAGGFGNGIFQVYQNADYTAGAGEFTVMTGPNNPAGPGHDVLYGDGVPGTSYLIVRDINPDPDVPPIDYVQGEMVTHDNEVSLDGAPQDQTINGNSTTTLWEPSGGPTIRETVAITGTTAADSRVTVTTQIQDFNTTKHKYQIQYLWDTQIGADDGPVIQPLATAAEYHPFGPVVGLEQTTAADVGSLAVADNDGNAGAPTFAVATSGVDNPQAAPEQSEYVCWADAIFAPIGGYATDPTRNVSAPSSDCLNSAGQPDSAVEYLWSADATAGDISVGASLRLAPATPYASTLKAGAVSLGSATATLTDTGTGKPIVGRTLTFSSGSTTYCTEVTDAQGKATCGGILSGLLGYDVNYSGDAIWVAAKAHGGLL